MIMELLKLSRVLRNFALALAGLAVINCAGPPSDWIVVPLQNGVFYQQRFDFETMLPSIEIGVKALLFSAGSRARESSYGKGQQGG